MCTTPSLRRAACLLFGCAIIVLGAACDEGPGAPDVPADPGTQISSVAILTAPLVANLGLPLPAAPIVELRDRAGRAVLTAGIAVTVSISAGTLAGTTTVNTDAHGRARFTDLVADGAAGHVELRFSCCGLAPAARPLSLSLADPAVARLDPVYVTGYAGELLSPGPRVLLMDGRKAPRAGAAVRFEFDSASALPAIAVTSGPDGVAVLPSFQFGDLPSTTLVSAVDVETGKSVSYTLQGIVRGTVQAESTLTVVSAGDVVSLPLVRVFDAALDPVAGALVRYRIASGDGVLSATEVHTGADGATTPVTLSGSSRGTTNIQVIAVGYSASPIVHSVVMVVPPLSLEYAGPCNSGCPASLDFTWPLVTGSGWAMDVFFQVRVRDAIGPVPGYEMTLTKDAAAPYFWVDNFDFEARTPEEMPLVSDSTGVARLAWRLPQSAGSYHFTMSGPMIETPWTYTVTVE